MKKELSTLFTNNWDKQCFSPPKLSVFLFLLGVVFLDVNLPRYSDIKTGNLVMLALVGLSLIVLIYYTNGRMPKIHIGSANKLLALYVILIFSSAVWAPSPASTLFQVFLISFILISALLLSYTDYYLIVRYTVCIAAGVAALSLIMIFIDESIAYQPYASGDRRELRGVFEHQLRLGLFMGLALFFAVLAWMNNEFSRAFPNKKLVVLTLPLILLVFIMAYARLYSLFIILAFFVTYSFSKSKVTRWVVCIFAFLVIAIAIFHQSYILDGLLEAGLDVGLNGRVTIWLRTLEETGRAMWLGHGFASFDTQNYDYMWRGFYRPPHPHNSYIQAYFETGLVGLFAILCLSICYLYVASKKSDREGDFSYTFFIVLVLTLGSLVGANYASKPTALFCIAFFLVSNKISEFRNLSCP